MKFYTGIGHRNTPLKMKRVIAELAQKLNAIDFVLRSGGAEGADSFFESGAGTKKEIYLPWKGFNESFSKRYDIREEDVKQVALWYDEYSPYRSFDLIKEGAKKLFTRNYYQLVGYDNIHSSYVFYYGDQDENGKVQGGTGFALFMAEKLNIPTYNVKEPDQYKKIVSIINKEKYKYVMSCVKHIYLFRKDDLPQEELKSFEVLYQVEFSDLIENENIRKILMSKYIKFKDLVDYKNIKLGSNIDLNEIGA